MRSARPARPAALARVCLCLCGRRGHWCGRASRSYQAAVTQPSPASARWTALPSLAGRDGRFPCCGFFLPLPRRARSSGTSSPRVFSFSLVLVCHSTFLFISTCCYRVLPRVSPADLSCGGGAWKLFAGSCCLWSRGLCKIHVIVQSGLLRDATHLSAVSAYKLSCSLQAS